MADKVFFRFFFFFPKLISNNQIAFSTIHYEFYSVPSDIPEKYIHEYFIDIHKTQRYDSSFCF